MLKIAIASDHGGFELKEKIRADYKDNVVEFIDFGTFSTDSVDYPDIAEKVISSVLNNEVAFAVLICGTGVGISIAANRHKGIRAAILYDEFVAQMAKEHNNANIIVFGGRTMKYEDVAKRISIFMNAEFLGGRHLNRIKKLG